METLVCVYCGKVTDSTATLEHVVAELLGFRQTLYRGAVCSKCNQDLGDSVDCKAFNEALIAAGLLASDIPGKKGVRKEVRTKKKGRVRSLPGGVEIHGADIGKGNEQAVSRFLAKVGVDVMTDRFGSVSVRAAYPELIRYVRAPKSPSEIWPYQAIYMVPGLVPDWGFFQHNGTTGESPLNFAAVTLRCGSGCFVIPLRRDMENFNEQADQFLQTLLVTAKEQGFEGFSMGYTAENNPG